MLVAGLDLLRDEGYEGLSIAEVCARANVSVGSIYARFKSKSALFAALQTRALKIIDGEQEVLFEGLPLPGSSDVETLDAVVHRVADHIRRHEHLLRVMILRGAVDEETRRRGSESSLRLAERFEDFLLTRIAGIAADDRELAVDIAFRILYATLTRRVMSGPYFESRRHLEWRELVDELSSALRSYVL